MRARQMTNEDRPIGDKGNPGKQGAKDAAKVVGDHIPSSHGTKERGREGRGED